MTLDPLLTASSEIRLHLGFALLALISGPIAIFRRRRDRLHRITGYTGALGMAGLAVTGLFIESDFALMGRFGPIHLLSVYALYSLTVAILAARRRQFEVHSAYMKSLWFAALGVAGLLTLLPGRTMNRALFGEASDWGLAVIAAGSVGLAVLAWRWWGPPRRHAQG